jgi:hypothetical protein
VPVGAQYTLRFLVVGLCALTVDVEHHAFDSCLECRCVIVIDVRAAKVDKLTLDVHQLFPRKGSLLVFDH